MRRRDLPLPGAAIVEPVDESSLQEHVADRFGLPSSPPMDPLARSRICSLAAESTSTQPDPLVRCRIDAGSTLGAGRATGGRRRLRSGEGEACLHGHRASRHRWRSVSRFTSASGTTARRATAWPYGGRRGRGSGPRSTVLAEEGEGEEERGVRLSK